MGIKDLNTFLQKKLIFPEQVSMKEFKNLKIAIDTPTIFHKFHSIALKKISNGVYDSGGNININTKIIEDEIKLLFLNLVNKFYEYKIQPIFIFEGKNPLEKKDESDRRKYESEKREVKREQTIDEISQLDDSDRFSLSNISKVKKVQQQQKINYNSFDNVYSFFKKLGIPVYKAIKEAETTACMLVLDEKVEAVFSNDSDCFAYTPNKIITSINYPKDTFNVFVLNNVLEKLNFTKEQLTDFCIMCGCDYNKRIRLLGPVKSYDLIKKYNSIDNIPEELLKKNIITNNRIKHFMKNDENIIDENTTDDVSVLKHELCRQLFSYRNYGETISDKDPERRKFYLRHSYKKSDKIEFKEFPEKLIPGLKKFIKNVEDNKLKDVVVTNQ